MISLSRRKSGESWRWRLKRISFLSLAVLIIASSQNAAGYSSGADPSVCDTMIPGHGAEPQTSPSPYKLTISKNAIMGFEKLDIILTSKSGTDEFKGFLIQVRKNGGDNKAVGEFNEAVDAGNARAMDCFSKKNSAMTHTSGDSKKSVAVQWIAPNDEDAEYQVFYSVVGLDGDTYWTRIPHEEKIRVTRNTQATTTAAPVIAASQNLLSKWKEYYTGCGESKGCFGIPGKCVEQYDPESDNPTTCDILVTWSKKGDINEYQLTGKPGGQSGYVALGLSKDSFMGDDSVVGCVNAQSTLIIERYHNPGKENKKHPESKLGLKPMGGDIMEGNIFCKFQQTNHTIGGFEVDLDKNNYYLLLSRAPFGSATGDLSKHPAITDREVSPQSVHISDTLIMGASANNWLIQLHGGLMVIAWLLCASTGMFTARYFKLTHTDFTPCGKAFWFALHLFCMSATIFLTICGSVFILIKKKSLDLTETHPKLGVIVVGLAILQVIIAFLRPHPGTPSRPYFNWFHWGVGNSAHIVGIVCILLASELSLADLKRFEADENLWGWILLGIVLFHVLMHIVMSIHTLWADKQMDSNNKKRAMQPGPMKTNGLTTEAPGTGFRTFMLSLYLLGMAAGAIVLTALVFWPKSGKEDDTPTS